MYYRPTPNHWVIDIEGDPIPSTQIFCICAVNVITQEEVVLTDYEEMKTWLQEQQKRKAVFVGHNILGYDFPTIRKILDIGFSSSTSIDTFLLSMVYAPSLSGGHSLEAWGKRVRLPKSKHEDFTKLTPEMIEYCLQDCYVTRRTYLTLIDRLTMVDISEESLRLEHQSWALIQKQKRDGFELDLPKTIQLYTTLRRRIDEVTKQINERWPPQLERVRVFRRPYKQNGEPTANFKRHSEIYPRVVVRGDEYHAYDQVYFNVASSDQRTGKLLELGWEPREDEYTPITDKGGGGNPKVTRKGELVPSLKELAEKDPDISLIAKWLELTYRAQMVNNWLEEYNEETGRIHGTLFLNNTLRYKHSRPNTANIPAVPRGDEGQPLLGEEGSYKFEARDCWTVRDKERYRLVGCDASGIQLRILAHYLKNDKFTEAVTSEDPHTANMQLFGLPSRDLTKTITYATLMGAGDKRVATEAKVSIREAKEVKALFFSQIPELELLIQRLRSEIERTGRITLVDGSRTLVSKPYMAIPYLLQGDESRIMRAAAVETYLQCLKREVEFYKVGDIHDEHQNEVIATRAEEFAKEVCPLAFDSAGKRLNYSVPIECDAHIGLTWAETH